MTGIFVVTGWPFSSSFGTSIITGAPSAITGLPSASSFGICAMMATLVVTG
jgi:hypothetical protein